MICNYSYIVLVIGFTLALSFINTGSTPKKGFIMKPGLLSDWGRGVITMPPVSAFEHSEKQNKYWPFKLMSPYTMLCHNSFFFTVESGSYWSEMTECFHTADMFTCLPPCIHNMASPSTNFLIVPLPCCFIQGLASWVGVECYTVILTYTK